METQPTFDDLARLDDREIQTLLHEADRMDVIVALKAASTAVRDKILANVSQRVRVFMGDEMELLGPLRQEEVVQVQSRVLQVAARLGEQGHLSWPPGPVAVARTPGPKLSQEYLALKESAKESLAQPLSRLSFAEIDALLVNLAEIARREGMLALDALAPPPPEPAAAKAESEFHCPWPSAALLLLLLAVPCQPDEPVLARLSFWVPPGRMGECAAVYRDRLAPVLAAHGLVEAAERSRPVPDSVFARLFAVPSPGAVAEGRDALARDPAWQQALEHLGAATGAAGPDGRVRHEFTVYRSPAGPGTTVTAGPGGRQGPWWTLNVQDGLPASWVNGILEDRDGLLWIAAGAAVTRFDGAAFTAFTRADGLVDGEAHAVLQDRDGRLWFGTSAGVSCYDGITFTSYTAADGLPGQPVTWLVEDREGRLWCGHPWEAQGVTCLAGGRFTTLSRYDGLAGNQVFCMVQDRAGNLWFGTDRGASRWDGRAFRTFAAADGLAQDAVLSLLEDRSGALWLGTGRGLSRYDGKSLRTVVPVPAGRADYRVDRLTEDRDGNLWLGSALWGAMRHDGHRQVVFTAENGLPSLSVIAMAADREGHVWVGTSAGGLSRYDGAQLATFSPRDGLPDSYVRGVRRDRRGVLWVGTRRGLARYDGGAFTSLAAVDALAAGDTPCLVEDGKGDLWFTAYGPGWSHVVHYDGRGFTALAGVDGLPRRGAPGLTTDQQGNLWIASDRGAIRYDGQRYTHLTTRDGLPSDTVNAIGEDGAGGLWFGTDAGASRYDGQAFTTLAAQDGLAPDAVLCLAADPRGGVWLGGGWDGPVTRHDGRTAAVVTARQGLPPGLASMTADRRGHLWICAYGAGIARYDGRAFQYLTRRDGLASDGVQSVYEDTLEGCYWIATDDGLTRYRPSTTRPAVRLEAVVADRDYGPVPALSLSSAPGWVEFRFQGRSVSTPPDRLAYVCRLTGRDPDGRVTRERSVRYQDLPRGEYRFEVQAVDRDLNYSDSATVRLTVHAPYLQWALTGGLGLTLVGLAAVTGLAVRRRRERDQARERLVHELESELQTAHDLQMDLMPKVPPRVAGMTVAARCLPANHVGGDFYQYFVLPDDGLALCLADVTGHAMEAAIPAVLFDGILDSQVRLGSDPEDLFARLNGALCDKLTGHTHVAFAMAQIDGPRRLLRLANAGCPYPCHYRSGCREVVEVALDAYPLGVKPDIQYRAADVAVEPGDYLVLYSDGIAEAGDGSGELFGFERTLATVRSACAAGLAPAALIDRLVAAVRAFTGPVPQADDMTCVAVRLDA
ncbi:MAG: two-component regulator propeller domain-containing protein [Candidatus Latescibacterota bacterium]